MDSNQKSPLKQHQWWFLCTIICWEQGPVGSIAYLPATLLLEKHSDAWVRVCVCPNRAGDGRGLTLKVFPLICLSSNLKRVPLQEKHKQHEMVFWIARKEDKYDKGSWAKPAGCCEQEGSSWGPDSFSPFGW